MKKLILAIFLAGLIDADGYFRRGEFALTLHKLDLSMGLGLKRLFGGRIRFYKARRAFNYELNSRRGLLMLAELTQHKFRLEKETLSSMAFLRSI